MRPCSDTGARAVSYFDSLSKGRKFDLTSPLHWGYLLLFTPATPKQVEFLVASLHERGFTTVEPVLRKGFRCSFLISLEEVKVHTVESYAARIEELEGFTRQNGCELEELFSVGE